ncbi:MAG TPA: fibronectin type III domain-containing protein [Candidatus Nitrosotalea sp.]|nr:fibronectin type III domain-containing protein [Candidatus Nitrosotalea sp.]
MFSTLGSVANALSLPIILQPPTNLTAFAVSTSQINLYWNTPSDLGSLVVTGYEIQRSTNGGSWSIIVPNTGSASTAYSDTGLSPSTSYTYRVYAITILVTSPPSNTATATTLTPVTVPQPPTGLGATADSSSQITLNWNAPSNNGGSPITGYKIERSTNGGSTWSNIMSNTGSTATTYSDTGLASSTIYTYRVSAINSVGTSSPSNIASATTSVAVTAPQPPTNLSATTTSSSQINLSWTAPANNGGSAITGYQIERSTDAGSTWNTISSNTGSAATTFSDTGLAQNTSYTYRVSAINSVGTSSPSNTASATTFVQMHSVTLAQPGLVASDSLTNETMTKDQLLANQQFWRYGGSATVNNTPYDISRDLQGFHIGVQAANDGNWTGFYGVAPSSNAVLFHAVITTPVESVPTTNDFYENGLYIQTSTQNVNYVTCFADTGTAGTEWAIVSATGNANGATNFNLLWVDQSPNQPLTRDCTMKTNGSNYLKVYLDGTMVYTSNTLNLQMPGQLIAFLEPQTSYAGQMLYGTYKDYYSTTDENVKITNNPSNAARVDLVSPSGTVLASSGVTSGTATIPVGQYHYPMAANIKVYDSANNVIASTANAVNIFGGDVYSYN